MSNSICGMARVVPVPLLHHNLDWRHLRGAILQGEPEHGSQRSRRALGEGHTRRHLCTSPLCNYNLCLQHSASTYRCSKLPATTSSHDGATDTDHILYLSPYSLPSAIKVSRHSASPSVL